MEVWVASLMDQRQPSVRMRVILLLLWPLWAPLFLLAQAIGICADGLLQLAESHLGRAVAVSAPLRWLIGLPGLIVFPALVGLRGLGILILSLGKQWLQLFGRPESGGAIAFGLGLVAALLLPIWLVPLLVIWLFRWVLWRLLIPEFARNLGSGRRAGSSRLVTFVGLRYLFGRRETALHSATSYYAAGGIALGVCALIVVLSVMSGFDKEVKERIIGTNAHVILLRFGGQGLARPDSLAQEVMRHPDVVAVAPFVYGKAMLSAGQVAEGAVVKGIHWADEIGVTALGRYVEYQGTCPRLMRDDQRLPGMILGRHIADNMGLLPGDELLLVSPAESRRTPLGFIPRMRKFRLEGIFDSGMYDFDASMAFIDISEGRSFFGLGERVTGLEIRIADMNRAPEVGEEIIGMLGGFPYRANNWIDLNKNLSAWMRTEKQAMFVILIMIILVAGFNITSSLIMLVMEKRSEIGILKTIGAVPASIRTRVWLVRW